MAIIFCPPIEKDRSKIPKKNSLPFCSQCFPDSTPDTKRQQLSVSFKVGTDKLFVVKKLDDFCSQVATVKPFKYGTSTVISHKLQDFTEESQKWIRYIDQIVREEARL